MLFIKGSVPGSKGGWLTVSDAVKVPRPADAPYPAALKTEAAPVVEEEIVAVEEVAVEAAPEAVAETSTPFEGDTPSTEPKQEG